MSAAIGRWSAATNWNTLCCPASASAAGARCSDLDLGQRTTRTRFRRWIDDPAPGSYVQEHRPAPGLPADDRDSLLIANPGAPHGIGASLEWLQAPGAAGNRARWIEPHQLQTIQSK